MRKLFLDDLRTVEMIYAKSEAQDFAVVRSCNAFIEHIKVHGLPDFISVDNDLGVDENEQVAPGRICRREMAGLRVWPGSFESGV